MFSTILIFSILVAGTFALQAQDPVVIQTWDFEEALNGWESGPGGASIELSDDRAVSGEQSVKLVGTDNHLEINLQNDVYKDLQEDDVLGMWVWISADDLAGVNGLQIFWQTTEGWSWNSQWIPASEITGDDWTLLEHTFPAIAQPLQRIGLQLLLQEGNQSSTPTLYVDDITISRVVEQAPETGDFRSVASGNWSNAETWEIFDGDNWVAATDAPTGTEYITIHGEDTVTVDIDITVTGYVKVEGEGNLTVDGDTGSLEFGDGSTYEHAQDAGSVPIAVWGEGLDVPVNGYHAGCTRE
jgi:hypothetical protein